MRTSIKQNRKGNLLGVLMNLLIVFLFTSCGTKKNSLPESNLFGVDLEQPNAVETMHNLLQEQKLSYNGRTLAEWQDLQFGEPFSTDYGLSEGEMVTIEMFDGNPDEAMKQYTEIDSLLRSKYEYSESVEGGAWLPSSKGLYKKILIDRYSYRNYEIIVVSERYSKNQDLDNPQRVLLKVGLLDTTHSKFQN